MLRIILIDFMGKLRFSNFIKYVDIDVDDERINALRGGNRLADVLTGDEMKAVEEGMTNRYNGIRIPWSEINAVALPGGNIVWAGDVAKPDFRYARCRELATALAS